MKPSYGFDTSAIVSLGNTNLIEFIVDNLSVIITSTILDELKEIEKISDSDGLAARIWLERSDELTIHEVSTSKQLKAAEDDLALICESLNIPMVTDDIRAVRKHELNVRCLFSVHIIYLLFRKGVITRKRAILSTERMRNQRDWKNNLISVVSRTLFD